MGGVGQDGSRYDDRPFYESLCSMSRAIDYNFDVPFLRPDDWPDVAARQGQPCWTLISQPWPMLSSRDQWPDHVCVDMARTLVQSWARDRALRTALSPLTAQSWQIEYPLPIGLQSLETVIRDVPRIIGGADPPEPIHTRYRLRACAVTDGDDWALLIAWTAIGESRVTAFFLGKDIFDPELGDDQSWWAPDRVAFEVLGNPLDADIQTFCHGARSWWAGLSGFRTGTVGRPRGTVTWTLDRIGVLLRQMAADRRVARPTLRGFVEWLDEPGRDGPSQRTIEIRLRDAGATWSVWRDAILS